MQGYYDDLVNYMDPSQNTNPTQSQLSLVAQSYAMREKYWPAYTWPLQTKYLNILDDKKDFLKKNNIDMNAFSRHKIDLFNKINASFYHLQRLKENEESTIELGKEIAKEFKKDMSKGVLGLIGAPYEPIGYEYEAILVTLRSALDITATMLSQPSGLEIDNISKLQNESKQAQKPNKFLKSVKKLLLKEENIKVLDEFINKKNQKSKRNYAVHDGSLPTGTINIRFTKENPDLGILKTCTMQINDKFPDLKKREYLEDYTTNLFYATCDLIIEALGLLVGETLPKGEKISIFEAKEQAKARSKNL